jgi:hypothetical protein
MGYLPPVLANLMLHLVDFSCKPMDELICRKIMDVSSWVMSIPADISENLLVATFMR